MLKSVLMPVWPEYSDRRTRDKKLREAMFHCMEQYLIWLQPWLDYFAIPQSVSEDENLNLEPDSSDTNNPAHDWEYGTNTLVYAGEHLPIHSYDPDLRF
jgi:hypothetical protein